MDPARALAIPLILAACSGAPARPPIERARLSPCRPERAAEDLLCGSVRVFEDRDAGKGRAIELRLIVLPALEGSAKREPLFELAGGPGAAATLGVDLYTGELRAYRAHRDVVLVDQRGTGGSNPLRCDERMLSPLGETFPQPYVESCRRALEPVADLRHYGTDAVADDLDDVRAALGYEKIDLLGLSYGTRVALVFARRHPQRLHRMVLFGVAPPSARLPREHAGTAEAALQLLFERCERDAACAAAFPRLRAEWRTVVDRLDAKPAKVRDLALTRAGFTETIRKLLYQPESSRRVPLIVHQAAAGDFAPFEQVTLGQGLRPPVADGDYLSVVCAEDTLRIEDLRGAIAASAATSFGAERLIEQRRACESWPSRTVPASFDAPVEADVPALIFAGRLDPVTPLRWAEETARSLKNARLVVLDEGAHMPIGLSHLECVDGAINAFLDGPPDRVDLSCMQAVRAAPFELR